MFCLLLHVTWTSSLSFPGLRLLIGRSLSLSAEELLFQKKRLQMVAEQVFKLIHKVIFLDRKKG